MPRLTISLLGPYEVLLEGQPVSGFPSAKVRALLAYLAVEADRPHTRETLAGLLWPDYPERSARTSLSNALSHLRTLLRDRNVPMHCLLVERETVQLDPQGNCWVDVVAFLEACRGAADGHHVIGLEEGVALYRGPFLEGFSLRDSPPFEQWVLATRERLQRQALEALGRLSTSYEERGDLERACAYARRRLEIEPAQEQAHCTLMRLLARGGDRSAALAQYEACVRALREELDVEPSPETVRLYEEIARGEWASAPLASSTRPSAVPDRSDTGIGRPDRKPEPLGPAHNLPAPVTPFVGREGELAELERLLADPQVRLVTVLGPGGSGKTRLALEAAARQVGRYPDGVWFVSLAPLRSIEGIAPAMAQAMGLPLRGGSDPRQQVLDYLRHKHVLLVPDNCEHLLEEVAFLSEVLAAAPEAKVLATSRARLSLTGEHVFALAGMRFPEKEADPDLWEYSAVQLFVQGARRADPKGFRADAFGRPSLGSVELGQVARICRLVQGMPLAILLAASAADVLALDEIAAGIECGFDALAAEWRDVPERQRSMRATFDHSWQLLTERQQEVFGALSVFRGGCAWQACQEVVQATPQELRALVDRSLLQRAPDGRYGMHELLREYAAERLCLSSIAAAGEEGGQKKSGARVRRCLSVPDRECVATSEPHCAAVRDRHCAYYGAALEAWAKDLRSARRQAALAGMEVEIDNARAAWDWAAERGYVERLDQAMEGLGLFYDLRVRYEEGEAAFRAAANALTGLAAGPSETTAASLIVRAGALTWQSHFCQVLGRTEQARELLQQGQVLLDDPVLAGHDTRSQRAFLLRTMGEIAYWSGVRRQSRQPYAESLALYRALGERWQMAEVLEALGLFSQSQGEFDEAEQLHREALAIRRALGDPVAIANSLEEVAWALQSRGRLDEAERLMRECLALCRDIGDRIYLAVALRGLAYPLYWQGRFAESRSLLEDAVAIPSDLTLHQIVALAHGILGGVQVHLGQCEEARAHLQQSLSLAREMNLRWGIAAALHHLGLVALAGEQYAEAERWLQESLAIWRESGQRSDVGWALAALGAAERELGQLALARGHLCEALQIASAIRDLFTPLYALPVAALLLADLGKTERAVEIYALASRYGFVANSRLWEDIAGRHIAAMAYGLPREAIEAAQARGRARDVWATVQELLEELGT